MTSLLQQSLLAIGWINLASTAGCRLLLTLAAAEGDASAEDGSTHASHVVVREKRAPRKSVMQKDIKPVGVKVV